MRKSSTHFPLLLALTLATGCSPIAHINFPDAGGGAELSGMPGETMSISSVVSLGRLGTAAGHGPLPNGATGIQTGSNAGMEMCPTNVLGNTRMTFKYADKCSKGSGIHQVSCRYQLNNLPVGIGKGDRLVSLEYNEAATLPYVIHSSLMDEFNTIQAVGSVRVTFRDPAASNGRMASRTVSVTKPDPGVLVNNVLQNPTEEISRKSVVTFPAGTTVDSLGEIIVSATVHCAVYKRQSIMVGRETVQVIAGDKGTLLVNDNISPFLWDLGDFSINTSSN